VKKTKLEPAFKVGIESTCSGAWPVIYETCVDPDNGEEWNREIARGNTAFVQDYDPYEKAVTWNQEPAAFKPHGDSDEAIADAYLMAAAPMMADALRAVVRSRSAPARVKRLAAEALGASEVPATIPQQDPQTC
jgi:hypothetical protein